MDVSAGFSLIPRSNLKIGGNELDEKAIESKNKTDVDCDDKGASVKRTEAECVSRSEKSCATDIYSECGSSSAPLEGNDPMKLWKAMKQNGFLSNPHVGGVSVTSSSCVVSSSHGGIPTCYVSMLREYKFYEVPDAAENRKR